MRRGGQKKRGVGGKKPEKRRGGDEEKRKGARGERRDKPNKIVNKALSWYHCTNDLNEKK